MKIIHLVGSREDFGGIFTTIRGISERDLNNVHVTLVDEKFKQTREPTLKTEHLPNLCADSESITEMLLSALRSLIPIYKLFRRGGYDVIHAHTRGMLPVAYILGYVFRIPTIITLHCYASRARLYEVLINLGKVRWVFLTENMANYYGVIPSKSAFLKIIPECFVSSKIMAIQPVEPSFGKGKIVRLVGVGNLWKWKGWHSLVEAVASVKEQLKDRMVIDVFGTASDTVSSKKYAKELADLVVRSGVEHIIRFRGFYPTVLQEVANADWFILPSYNEPCSLALLEALALGRPALVTRSGGNVDIIREKFNGHLFKFEDVAALGRLLVSCASNTLERASAQEISQAAGAFSDQLISTELDNVYREAFK